ncbi:hypothetical protein B7463_g11201, partial [Scytalidium lignicola]
MDPSTYEILVDTSGPSQPKANHSPMPPHIRIQPGQKTTKTNPLPPPSNDVQSSKTILFLSGSRTFQLMLQLSSTALPVFLHSIAEAKKLWIIMIWLSEKNWRRRIAEST